VPYTFKNGQRFQHFDYSFNLKSKGHGKKLIGNNTTQTRGTTTKP